MRSSVTLFTAFAFVACVLTAVAAAQSHPSALAKPSTANGQKASTEPPLEFLIDSAAADFHNHGPHPARFRNVRVGHVTNADGTKQYMLCGEFQPAQQKGNAQWLSFVTIKTSGYEQYIGAESANFCRQPKFTLDKAGDQSSTLQSRLDSMQ
jgi:hypothetical protein